MDEFAYFGADAKRGVLHIRELPDDVVLTVARDVEHTTPEFREVYAFMESITTDGRPTSPAWVTGTALEEAYLRRSLISESEMHYLREKY